MQRWLGFEELPHQKHLLVLPFTNVGGDPTNQAFCDGLVETLTGKLIQLGQFEESLWVVPAADVRESGIAGAGAALQEFGVNLVVAGSMQRFSDSFRLSLSLVDTETLRRLRSKVITDRMDNIAALQDGIVEKLTEMLDLELPLESQRVLTAGRTNVPEAYEFYLQARGYLQGYQKAENLDTAIDLFERAIGEDSLYALACAGLGEAYRRKYDATGNLQCVELAVEYCKRAIELNELLAPVHLTLGLICRKTGRYEEAMTEFQLALEHNPADASVYLELAEVYLAQGRVLEAELTYQKAIESKPDYWAGYNSLGWFYYTQGRYEDAAAQIHHAVELNPMYAKGFRNLGGIYFLLGRRQEAEQMYQRSLELKPDYKTYSNLATGYFHQERYADAARMFEKALELNKDNDYRIWAYLASAYYWTPGERDRALIIYQRAITMAEEQLKVNPHDPELLSDLALYCATAGKREKALAILQQVVDLEPDILPVIIRIGHTYEMLGEREPALKWIEKALEKEYESLKEIEHLPDLRELRADDRFKLLLQRIADKTKKMGTD